MLHTCDISEEPEWLVYEQDADGQWREDVLEALDFVIEAARAHGLRVMLSFADNWKYLGKAPAT